MKKRKYRIAKDFKGYYPQVRVGFFVFSRWKRISTRLIKGEFYLLNDLCFPRGRDECVDIIDGYEESIINKEIAIAATKEPLITYEYI